MNIELIQQKRKEFNAGLNRKNVAILNKTTYKNSEKYLKNKSDRISQSVDCKSEAPGNKIEQIRIVEITPKAKKTVKEKKCKINLKNFFCSVCGEDFANKSHHKRHQIAHSSSRTYHCPVSRPLKREKCRKVFQTTRQPEPHQSESKNRRKPVKQKSTAKTTSNKLLFIVENESKAQTYAVVIDDEIVVSNKTLLREYESPNVVPNIGEQWLFLPSTSSNTNKYGNSFSHANDSNITFVIQDFIGPQDQILVVKDV